MSRLSAHWYLALLLALRPPLPPALPLTLPLTTLLTLSVMPTSVHHAAHVRMTLPSDRPYLLEREALVPVRVGQHGLELLSNQKTGRVRSLPGPRNGNGPVGRPGYELAYL